MKKITKIIHFSIAILCIGFMSTESIFGKDRGRGRRAQYGQARSSQGSVGGAGASPHVMRDLVTPRFYPGGAFGPRSVASMPMMYPFGAPLPPTLMYPSDQRHSVPVSHGVLMPHPMHGMPMHPFPGYPMPTAPLPMQDPLTELINQKYSEEVIIELFQARQAEYQPYLCNQSSPLNNTPIHTAIQHMHPELAETLIKAVSFTQKAWLLTIKNLNGNTILFEALKTIHRSSNPQDFVSLISFIITEIESYIPKATYNYLLENDADGIKPGEAVTTVQEYFRQRLADNPACESLRALFGLSDAAEAAEAPTQAVPPVSPSLSIAALRPTEFLSASADVVVATNREPASPTARNLVVEDVVPGSPLVMVDVAPDMSGTTEDQPTRLTPHAMDTSREEPVVASVVAEDEATKRAALEKAKVLRERERQAKEAKRKSEEKKANRLRTQEQQRIAQEKREEKAKAQAREQAALQETSKKEKKVRAKKMSGACAPKPDTYAADSAAVLEIVSKPKSLSYLRKWVAENPTAFPPAPTPDTPREPILLKLIERCELNEHIALLVEAYPELIFEKDALGYSVVETILNTIIEATADEDRDDNEEVLREILSAWYIAGLIPDDYKLTTESSFLESAAEIRIIGGRGEASAPVAAASSTRDRRARLRKLQE